ncbi:splicing factor-like protein 1 isoform X3 [Senna tora]|uniref:Splicing factor-like protein 1 isoform X3 n=1 Tax=Senna tora TaxID=362788 RepID=A0A834W2R8_9FABA|nr:splicing factor-like protein 1 isoform X3 [Senna tora]
MSEMVTAADYSANVLDPSAPSPISLSILVFFLAYVALRAGTSECLSVVSKCAKGVGYCILLWLLWFSWGHIRVLEISSIEEKKISANAESASAAKPDSIKMSGVTSSAVPTGGQKLSMLAAKSGFVIPKNKLSGSLVPIFRGAKNHGSTGPTSEEISKQIHRKTKWGPDLTQDAAVRRGRALALQIRVDQITQQLKSRKLEVEGSQDSSLAKNPDQSYPDSQIDKKSEMLELEKREVVGEILILDPSYKPPPGFKPLLKEVNVPLPVKEYPGFNFTALIYGPEGDNQKRLEKDEIKPGNDVPRSYEEMHVNVSADSFEKVDAAVSIIELLIASVTGNLAAASSTTMSVSGNNTNVLSRSEDHPPSHPIAMDMENMAMVQPVAGVTQMLGDHSQYYGPWFSAVSSHNPVYASSGNIAPTNPSGLSRPLHFPSQSMNTSNVASTFVTQPAPFTGFNSVIPNRPFVLLQTQPTRENFQHSHMTQAMPLGHTGPPRNPSIVSIQTSSAQRNASSLFPIGGSQPAVGQLRPLMPSMPQPMSGILSAPVSDRSLIPLGVSSGLDGVSLGLSNMGQMAPSVVPPPRPVPLQSDVAFKLPVSNIPMASHSASFSPHQAGISPGLPSSLGSMQPPLPAANYSSVNHLSGSASLPPPPLPTSLSSSGVSYQAPVKPPLLTASNSGNFTFQSQSHNADFQVVSRPNTASQGGTREQFSVPRPQSFGFAVPDRPVNQIFPKTLVPAHVDQTQAAAYASFGGRPGAVATTPRHTVLPFPNQPAPMSPVPQMGMRNFFPSPQMPSFPGPGVPRAGSTPMQQNHPAQRWPDVHLPPNQKFGNSHSVASGRQVYPADQIYDPFSPTSVAPPQQRNDLTK